MTWSAVTSVDAFILVYFGGLGLLSLAGGVLGIILSTVDRRRHLASSKDQ